MTALDDLLGIAPAEVIDHLADRDLPAGPWTDEADKIVWVDPNTDLDCMVVRNQSGALCGYVGVGPDHPWHGKAYGYDANLPDGTYPDEHVEVHGGLTYSAACQEDGVICHVAQEGRPEPVWWFGFDCAHWCDLVPAMADYGFPDATYRDVTYVIAEVRSLARQLAAVSA